jgi:hypothetical protein
MNATKPRRLRSLNNPRRITVEADVNARPTVVVLSGRRLEVEAHHETWRIDDEWWRPQPISRIYCRLSLEDGRVIDVYHDLVGGDWFRQAYG